MGSVAVEVSVIVGGGDLGEDVSGGDPQQAHWELEVKAANTRTDRHTTSRHGNTPRQVMPGGCSVNDVGKHNQSGMRVAVRCRLSSSSRSGPNTLVTIARPGITMTTSTTPDYSKPAPAQYFLVDSVMCLVRHEHPDRLCREPAADVGRTD